VGLKELVEAGLIDRAHTLQRPGRSQKV
jgi:hypothetical protein